MYSAGLHCTTPGLRYTFLDGFFASGNSNFSSITYITSNWIYLLYFFSFHSLLRNCKAHSPIPHQTPISHHFCCISYMSGWWPACRHAQHTHKCTFFSMVVVTYLFYVPLRFRPVQELAQEYRAGVQILSQGALGSLYLLWCSEVVTEISGKGPPQSALLRLQIARPALITALSLSSALTTVPTSIVELCRHGTGPTLFIKYFLLTCILQIQQQSIILVIFNPGYTLKSLGVLLKMTHV